MYLAAVDTSSTLLAFLEPFWLGFQVVFGIGLMIFIHELGHFLAAKKIGVRVETFSLGFGPRIWGFRRGDTDYRLSVIPLGGYVKMTGENPEDSRTDSLQELQNRTVFERMVIFSAGVVVNFIFAFITFPIIFALGVPFVKPEAGKVISGGPAWKAGIEPGDRILEVNGNTIYEFNDIPLNIALGRQGENELLIERHGKEFTVAVVPEKNEEEGRYQIRILWPTCYTISVDRDSPAAKSGLKTGDRLLSIDGMAPEAWMEGEGIQDPRPITLHVARDVAGSEETIEVTLVPEEVISEDRRLIGIMQRFNKVAALRGDLAACAGGLQPGDSILRIDGRVILTQGDYLEVLGASTGEPMTVEILRNGRPVEVRYEPEWRVPLMNDLALAANSESNSVAVMPGGALEALGDPTVRDGMRILAVNGEKTSSFGDISDIVQKADGNRFRLTVDLPGEEGSKVLEVEALPSRQYLLGFNFLPDLQIRKLNIVDAITAGFNCSIYMIKTCYLTLSRIITGDVASKNLGGIITISRASYSFAELGIARLFFFLAILSINLGFLNILPIPILDGGHLLFLLIEKIKGSPVSEKVMGYSQIVGLAFVLALLIYVTYNDILRLL